MAVLERFVAFSMLTEESSKSMQRIKAAYMGSLGLHSGDALFLAVLEKHPEGLSAAALARECRLDKAAVSRALPHLLSMGVIAYAQGHSYRSPILLTQNGRDVLAKMDLFTADTLCHTSDDIPNEDLETFYRVFRTLEERLTDHARALEEMDETAESNR